MVLRERSGDTPRSKLRLGFVAVIFRLLPFFPQTFTQDPCVHGLVALDRFQKGNTMFRLCLSTRNTLVEYLYTFSTLVFGPGLNPD